MKCLAVSPGGVLASGGRDDAIIIWDVRSPDPTVVNVVKYSHKPASHQGLLAKCCGRKAGQTKEGGRLLATKASVTALEFIDENKVVSCSDLDGVVKVWDIRMSYDRYTGEECITVSVRLPSYNFRENILKIGKFIEC